MWPGFRATQGQDTLGVNRSGPSFLNTSKGEANGDQTSLRDRPRPERRDLGFKPCQAGLSN